MRDEGWKESILSRGDLLCQISELKESISKNRKYQAQCHGCLEEHFLKIVSQIKLIMNWFVARMRLEKLGSLSLQRSELEGNRCISASNISETPLPVKLEKA